MTDEERIAAVYRRLPPVSPDPSTDASILAAARRATLKRHSRFVPIAAAATLVLGVGVAWQVLQYQPPLAVDPVLQPEREALQVDESVPVQSRTTVQSPPIPPAEAKAQERRPASMAQPRRQSLDTPSLSADVADAPSPMQRKSAAARASSETAAQAGAESAARCRDEIPADGLSPEQWTRLIEEAAASGDVDRQRCLEQAFRDRFRPKSDR